MSKYFLEALQRLDKPFDKMIDGKRVRATLSEEAQERIAQAHPLVFTSHVDYLNTLDYHEDAKKDVKFLIPEEIEIGEELDLPFRSCWFEMLGIGMEAYLSASERMKVVGIWVYEKVPREYEILWLMWVEDRNDYIFAYLDDEETVTHFMGMVKSLLMRMNKEEIGHQVHAAKVKIKRNGQKEFRKIHKTVFISPKRHSSGVALAASTTVDWSHRWEVRGHWRSIPENRIGHDRDGNPICNGYTWVKAHTKGPEDAVLIKKTRVVKASHPSFDTEN